MKRTALSILAIASLAWTTGCSVVRHVVKNNDGQNAPALARNTDASSADAAEPSVRNSLLHSVPDVKTVHFEYDSARLTEESQKVLEANAAWIKEHSGVNIQVAGNCDQRGTEAYNLALGQKRASAVRKYYTYLGVPGSRIATISYGKEKPVCQEMEETCWQQNRRAETLVAFPQDMSQTHPAKTPHP